MNLDDVRTIRQLRSEGTGLKVIAKQYNVLPQYISKICRNEVWIDPNYQIPFQVEPVEGEEWKTIPKYPDYMVSNYGRVKGKFNLLKARTTNQNYHVVGLYKDNVGIRHFVHVLVCTLFNGPSPFEGALVRHWDDNRDNNRADNLLWGTDLDNAQDRKRNRDLSHLDS